MPVLGEVVSLSSATHHHFGLCQTRWHAHENCMHAKQIIILFYICFYRTIFFYIIIYGKCIKYIYHWRGVFPLPEVKACKKIVRIREQDATWFVSSVHTRAYMEAIYRYIIKISRYFIIDIIILYQHFYHKNMYAHQYNISTELNILKCAYDFPKCTYYYVVSCICNQLH